MSLVRFGSITAYTRAKQILNVSVAIAGQKISRYPDFVENFERRFATYIGKKYALSFCNGTSAIDATMFAANIGPGDEVIVPSCTFHASIDPIVNLGATPVFVDVNPDTFTLCPDDVSKKITSRTKAVVIVHLFGIPADMNALREVLRDRKIITIEDASHAHGARYGDKMCGGMSDFGIFSIQGDKAIAGGEGGIVVTDDRSAFIRMSMWGHFDRHANLFSSIGAAEFADTGIGYKRRMAPLSAILANADLDYLDKRNEIMRQNASVLDQELGRIKHINVSRPGSNAVKGGLFTGYPIRIMRGTGSAERALTALHKKGIQASSYPFPLHHKLSIYNDLKFRKALLHKSMDKPEALTYPSLPVTESLHDEMILLSKRYLAWLRPRTLSIIRNALANL